MYDYTQDNLTIATSCSTCLALDEKCDECLEVSEARLSDRAWDIVDDGNNIYKLHLTYSQTQPSQSDWVSSETVTKIKRDAKGEIESISIRNEFSQPVAWLIDGGELDNTWELDDMTQAAREVVCSWCHITTPKSMTECQSCDRSLVS